LTLLIGWSTVHWSQLMRLLSPTWWARGPIMGFVPVTQAALLLFRRQWTTFVTAVDLASAGPSNVASPFLSKCKSVPRVLEPVRLICLALVDAEAGNLGSAAQLSDDGVKKANLGPPTVLGWCLAGRARILGLTGRSEESALCRRTAMSLLRGRRSRRHWRRLFLEDLELRLKTSSLRQLLIEIHWLRLKAMRSRDYELLQETEIWLVALMIRIGNDANTAETLIELVSGSDGRRAFHERYDRTAEQLLLRASVLQPASQYEADPKRDALAALAHLDPTTRPLTATAAMLILARIFDAEQNPQTAISYAAQAFILTHNARYLLPSREWRDSWSYMHLDAYATVLRLASGAQDHELVAEILEAAKGTILPRVRTVEELHELSLVRTVTGVSSETSRPGSAGNLIQAPPYVTVAGSRRLPNGVGDSDEEVDLERQILALAGPCWYWSAAAVLDRYYWVVRDPEGQWTHGWADVSSGSAAATAYIDLLNSLPFTQPGEDVNAALARSFAGPLGRDARSSSAELELLSRVATAFVPPPLAAGLRSGAQTQKIVVSVSGALGHLPIAALPLTAGTDLRIVERASVTHLPAWSNVATKRVWSRRSPMCWPTKLALVGLDGQERFSEIIKPPPDTAHTISGPVTKTDCRNILQAMSDRSDWLLYVAGHVASNAEDPSQGGLVLASSSPGANERTEVLCLEDLLGKTFPMPERVVLVGCESIGLSASPSVDRLQLPTNEWLGLGAAVLSAGALHVCCTLYTVNDNDSVRRIGSMIAQRMSSESDPARGLRSMQLAELDRWRSTGDTSPFLWQAFVYVGCGPEL
jgi:hypothetical protein